VTASVAGFRWHRTVRQRRLIVCWVLFNDSGAPQHVAYGRVSFIHHCQAVASSGKNPGTPTRRIALVNHPWVVGRNRELVRQRMPGQVAVARAKTFRWQPLAA